jgi:cholesterol oxidase
MGRDLANGRIELVPLTNLLRIEWDVGSNMPLYSTEERLSQDVAKALGGAMGYNPFWKFLNQPISVHNLGGCVMAESPSAGVVDPDGQVHGYPNLYVMDGAALPAATGTRTTRHGWPPSAGRSSRWSSP